MLNVLFHTNHILCITCYFYSIFYMPVLILFIFFWLHNSHNKFTCLLLPGISPFHTISSYIKNSLRFLGGQRNVGCIIKSFNLVLKGLGGMCNSHSGSFKRCFKGHIWCCYWLRDPQGLGVIKMRSVWAVCSIHIMTCVFHLPIYQVMK
jgi:hypothetical protein